MAKVKILIDTDIFIDYLNVGFLDRIFEGNAFQVYFSAVTRKELLSKPGLRDFERKAIVQILKKHRLIRLDRRIAIRYGDLRQAHPSLDKEDALIAATALVKRLPLLTRNLKHYRIVKGLVLFKGSV